MSNRTWAIIGIVVVVLALGGFALLRMPKATTAAKQAGTTANNAVIMTKTSSTLGQYLTDASGKALYTYNKDTNGVSNCTGTCLLTWPAYVDSGSTTGLPSEVATITRLDNGKTQYTYNGMPLYYFAADVAGHVNGNGVGGFTVAKPATSAAAASTPAASTPDPAATAAPAAATESTPTPTAAATTAPTPTPTTSAGSGW